MITTVVVSVLVSLALAFGWFLIQSQKKEQKASPAGQLSLEPPSESLLDEALRKKTEMQSVQKFLQGLMEQTGIRCDVANQSKAVSALCAIVADPQLMAVIGTLQKAGIVVRIGIVPDHGCYINDRGHVCLDEDATAEQLRAFLLR